MIFLAFCNIEKDWMLRQRLWKPAANQFAMMFVNRSHFRGGQLVRFVTI